MLSLELLQKYKPTGLRLPVLVPSKPPLYYMIVVRSERKLWGSQWCHCQRRGYMGWMPADIYLYGISYDIDGLSFMPLGRLLVIKIRFLMLTLSLVHLRFGFSTLSVV
jgi:hypothetical protein